MYTNFVHINSIHDYHLFSNDKTITAKFIFKLSLDLCVKKKSINKSTKKSIIKKCAKRNFPYNFKKASLKLLKKSKIIIQVIDKSGSFYYR